MIPGSFSRKSVKNHQKALGFSLFRAWHSVDPQNLIKPVENDDPAGLISILAKGVSKKKGLADCGFPSPKGEAVALWAWKATIPRTFFFV